MQAVASGSRLTGRAAQSFCAACGHTARFRARRHEFESTRSSFSVPREDSQNIIILPRLALTAYNAS